MICKLPVTCGAIDCSLARRVNRVTFATRQQYIYEFVFVDVDVDGCICVFYY